MDSNVEAYGLDSCLFSFEDKDSSIITPQIKVMVNSWSINNYRAIIKPILGLCIALLTSYY